MNDILLGWQQALFLAGSNILSSFVNFLPDLLGALIIFFVGLVLAKWVKALVVKVLGLVSLDKLVRSTGLNQFLTKAEIKVKVEAFLGEIVRWLIIAVFSIAGINVLGLTTVSVVLTTLFAYIPNIISAVLILTVGVMLAGL